jgi:hypothetical protein
MVHLKGRRVYSSLFRAIINCGGRLFKAGRGVKVTSTQFKGYPSRAREGREEGGKLEQYDKLLKGEVHIYCEGWSRGWWCGGGDVRCRCKIRVYPHLCKLLKGSCVSMDVYCDDGSVYHLLAQR